MRAFKQGVSVLDEATLNDLLLVTPFSLVFPGTVFDEKTGSGVYEHSLANYSYAIRIKATDTTEIGRIELEMDRDGLGADVVIEVRGSDFSTSGDDGTLLRTILYPAEWIGTSRSYISIPIALTGLTAGANYWLVVRKAGDAANKIDLVGEASSDSSHPVYRRAGDSGAWSVTNAVHFRAYAGLGSGTPRPLHILYSSGAYATIKRDGCNYPEKIQVYCPDAAGNKAIIQRIGFPRIGASLTGGREL